MQVWWSLKECLPFLLDMAFGIYLNIARVRQTSCNRYLWQLTLVWCAWTIYPLLFSFLFSLLYLLAISRTLIISFFALSFHFFFVFWGIVLGCCVIIRYGAVVLYARDRKTVWYLGFEANIYGCRNLLHWLKRGSPIMGSTKFQTLYLKFYWPRHGTVSGWRKLFSLLLLPSVAAYRRKCLVNDCGLNHN